jgi:hypothetical protein
VFVYAQYGHGALFGGGRLPFVPLLIMSLYCTAGLLWGWWLSLRLVLSE